MPYVYQTFDADGKPHPLWRFQYRDRHGKKRTGTGYDTKTKTRNAAIDIERREKRIRDGIEKAPKKSDKVHDFATVAAEYVQWGRVQGKHRPWTEEHAEKREWFLTWWKKELRLSVLTDLEDSQSRVEAAARILLGTGKKKRTTLTVQNYVNALTAFCDWCFARGYLDDDPLKRLQPLSRETKNKRRAMTIQEVGMLLAHCAPYRRLMYETALSTGLRANELRQLKVEDFDAAAGGLVLRAAWTKNRRAGFQPLPAALVTKLTAESHGKAPADALLFVPVHTARDLKKDFDAAKLTKYMPNGKVDFHALRVAFTTFVFEAGATVKEAQTLARHSTPDLTLNVYARARDERLSKVAETINKNVFSPEAALKLAEQKNAEEIPIGEEVLLAGVHGTDFVTNAAYAELCKLTEYLRQKYETTYDAHRIRESVFVKSLQRIGKTQQPNTVRSALIRAERLHSHASTIGALERLALEHEE